MEGKMINQPKTRMSIIPQRKWLNILVSYRTVKGGSQKDCKYHPSGKLLITRQSVQTLVRRSQPIGVENQQCFLKVVYCKYLQHHKSVPIYYLLEIDSFQQ